MFQVSSDDACDDLSHVGLADPAQCVVTVLASQPEPSAEALSGDTYLTYGHS